MMVFEHRWQRMVVTLICVTFLFYGCFESQEEKLERLIGAGDAAFSQRDYKAAFGQWHEAMQIAPEDTYISEKLGHACLRLAKFRDADQYFRQTVDGRPEAWATWIEIGKLKVLSLDLRGAVDIRKKLKGNGVNNAQALIYHGDLAMLDNDFGEAELDYRQALSMAPDLPDGMIKLAICLQAQKKDADAADIVGRLTARDIQHPLVLIQLAHYWNLTDDFDTAESYLKKALEHDPADLRLQIRAANFFTAAGQYEKAMAILEPILNDASLAISKEYAGLLIQQSRIADAIAFIEPLVSGHPNDDALRLMMGKCRLLSGDPLLAASEINTVAEKNPDSPLVHYLLGVAYLAGGYNQLGMQHLTTALTLDTGFSDAELALAAYYYKTGDYEIARQHAQRVAEKEPENFRPHMISGAAYLDQGSFQAARRDFGMAAILNPDSVSPLYFGALAAEAAGSTQEALDQYEQILSENPMLVDVAEQYKNLLIKNGQFDRARQFFEAMVKQHPDHAYPFHLLGELFLLENELELAADAFRRAISIDSRLMTAYLPLVHI
jgi:tetratricopeptide (TPR) repeat protein